jgi:membrane-bound lytic murein transglycosylase D
MFNYRNNRGRIYAIVKFSLIFTVVLGFILMVSFSENESKKEKESTTPVAVSGVYMPEQISFAGEKVPVNCFDVKEGLERELLVNTYWHSQTSLLIKRSRRYLGEIDSILRKNNVPADFKYLALAESGLANVTSPAGAVGFWQFIPATGKEYGLEINDEIDERYHIEKATEAACKFLKESYSQYGSWTMAAASYNCGRTSLSKQIQKQYSSNYYDLLLNDETARYLYRIISLKLVVGAPQKYGFDFSEDELYQPIPYKIIQIKSPIKDLALFAFQNGTNYKMLKYLNPWLRSSSLANKELKSYSIKIPAAGFRDYDKHCMNIDTVGNVGQAIQNNKWNKI